ncbi:glycosaminoglycan xylosylkinase-like isoform X2 [Patiria miniata]|uniref:FAM20 C-terminal domain-containing protein n=1 Tax=Patiria miniata TaxID=46514 RepID=A0A913Z353_PATMI|nr:glycosaminoglycan xylosylkinase-like isoform X2 [Patiria miniata]
MVWLKRRRVLVLASIFILTWLVIIIYTPSPSGSQKNANHGAKRGASQQKPPQSGSRRSGKLPRIRIVDVDENPSIDKEEQKIETQLRDASQDFSDNKNLTFSKIKILDGENGDSKALLNIELDLIPHALPEGVRTQGAIWNLAGSWVNSKQITPADNPDLGMVLNAMANRPIVKADIGYKGTQLKARLELSGGQWVVFKPGRYTRDHVIDGTPYAGYDRHTGEIAAFHLDRVLGFHRAPIVVGRRINLRTEIKPVASQSLLNTFLNRGNQTCFYGKCYYCKPEEPACADEHDMMEGSLTLWLPRDKKLKKWHHLWSRTYRDNKKAQWEHDNNYCQGVLEKYPLEKHRHIMDILDTAAFDYLIGNADRHQYETFEADGDQAMLLLMDSAKSFGNPHHDERSILAPLYQCCKKN